MEEKQKLETASIAKPLQNQQHAQNPLMLSTIGRKGKREGRWKELYQYIGWG